jgi:hypothetical protein
MAYALKICALLLYVSGYPFIGELARLIQEQNPVYVCHHLLMINTKNAFVPSLPFSHGLTRPLVSTARGQENQSTQEDSQNHFTYKKRSIFHHFSLFLSLTSQLRFSYNHFCTCQPARSLFEQQKPTAIYKCIIAATPPTVNSNRAKKASSLVREYLLKSKFT